MDKSTFINRVKIAIKQKQLLDMFKEDEQTDAVKKEIDWVVDTFGNKSDGAMWYTRIFREGLRQKDNTEAKKLEKSKGKLKHFFDTVKTYPTMLKGFTFKKDDKVDETLNKLKDLEEKAKAQRKETQKNQKDKDGRWTAIEEGKIFLKLNDKWAWWNLDTDYSEAECKAMGHCGQAEFDDSTLLSLREFAFKKDDNNYYYPHLTFEYDEGSKTLLQRKGIDNTKPEKKYHKQIVKLLEHKDIHHLEKDTYEPETNFDLEDLSEEDLEKLDEKESLKFTNELDYSLKKDPGKAYNFIKEHGLKDSNRPVAMYKLIAKSKYAKPRILSMLAVDDDEDVRIAVALNENSSFKVIERLAKDKFFEVRVAAAKSKNIAPDVLKELSEDKHVEVRTQVALNESTPDNILKKLAEDKSKDVRLAVIDNDNTPLDIIRKLKNDKEEVVRLEADKILRTKKSNITHKGSIMDKKIIIAKTLKKLAMNEKEKSDYFKAILAQLMYMQVWYNSCHWLSKGDNYYGDHLLFERLYDALSGEIDGIAEKGIMMGGEETVSRNDLIKQMMEKEEKSADDIIKHSIELEQQLLSIIATKKEEMSGGTQNLLDDISDNHERNLYLLGQRNKN